MAPAVCLGNTNRPLTTAVWEPGAATRSWVTLVPSSFFCPGSDSVGISCWPLTWGHSTSCDITVWVLATRLEAYFKANTEQRQAYLGKEVTQTWASAKWNLLYQRLPLCHSCRLESGRENAVPLLVALQIISMLRRRRKQKAGDAQAPELTQWHRAIS